MRADQKKFGKASWAAAAERMEKLQYAVSKETLQMMRAKEICLEQRKHALKEEVTKPSEKYIIFEDKICYLIFVFVQDWHFLTL